MFNKFMEDEQVRAIKEAPLYAGKRHPTWAPLFYEKPSSVDILTRKAADSIGSDPLLKVWCQKLGMRMADLENFPDAASALSELRVLSALREAGLDTIPLAPGETATPDFLVRSGEEELVVEVFSKHEDGAQTLRREDVAQGKDVPGVERSSTAYPGGIISSTTQVLYPGGVPDTSKLYDSVQANVISKLCAAKNLEQQMDLSRPAVLWLDLSYFCDLNHTLIEQTNSLISGHSGLTSGAIWHAFYGWKGAPLIEEGSRRRIFMGHEGRYRFTGSRKSRLAATLISFERAVVLFENPWADKRLPKSFREACLKLPWFKLEHSVADWVPGEAEARIEIGKKSVEALAHLALN